MTTTDRRPHSAKWSQAVLDVIDTLQGEDNWDDRGWIVDPFAGIGNGLADVFNHNHLWGIEIEAAWADHPDTPWWIRQGDALDASYYPMTVENGGEGIGAIVTSPTYGNRMADRYRGPKCSECDGHGIASSGLPADVDYCGHCNGSGVIPFLTTTSAESGEVVVVADGDTCGHCKGYGRMLADGTAQPDPPDPELTSQTCDRCKGSGFDGTGRRGYAVDLGKHPEPGSSASLQWGPAYRIFHHRWLALIADLVPAGRPIVINMSDHIRQHQRRHVCAWWIQAAAEAGLALAGAYPAETPRWGSGANRDARTEHELVLLFHNCNTNRSAE